MVEMSAKPYTDVRIQNLDHTTIPVRDQFAAARFYAVVFNGEIDHVGRPFGTLGPRLDQARSDIKLAPRNGDQGL